MVDGDRATGTVTFPLAFEGPPGIVHGGFLAMFFDCVVQHHNCDVGVAGKTTSLLVGYRRPDPARQHAARSRSTATPTSGASHRRPTASRWPRRHCARATMEAVAGDRSRLPSVSPRRRSTMSAVVVDAGDALPLTVPALLRGPRVGAAAHPLLVCDDDDADLRRGRARDRRRSPRAFWRGARARARTSVCCIPNGPGFVVGWLAAARIGAVTIPLSTFSTGAELRTLLRSADVELLLATPKFPRVATTSQSLRDVVPSSPALRLVAIDRAEPGPAGGRSDRSTRSTRSSWPGTPSPTPSCRGGARRVRVGPHGDRAHLGLHQRTEGRDPPARPADPPRRQPQRAAPLRRPTRCCSRTRRSSGSAGSRTACSARCSPARRLVCSNATDAAATLDLLERTRPTMVNGFAAVGRAPRRGPDRSPAATCRSIRRGNLWPIMPADVRAARPRAAPQHARHDRGRQRLPRERRRDRPARAPPGSFGRPVPGFEAKIVDPETGTECAAGEVGRAVVPRSVPHGGLLRPRAARDVHARRLVPHRRPRSTSTPTASSTSPAGAAT